MIDLVHAKKILLLGSARLGDTICHTLALQVLSTAKPDAVIDWVVFSTSAAEVLAHNPRIRHVYVDLSITDFQQVIEQYDAVIGLMDNQHTRAYEPFIPTDKYEPRHQYPPLVHIAMCPVYTIKELLKQPDAPIPKHYELFPQPCHVDKVNSLLAEAGVRSGDLLIGFHMGCLRVARGGLRSRLVSWFRQSREKFWPFANYAKLHRKLRKCYPHLKLILTGVESEHALLEKTFKRAPDVINLAGKLSVLETAALLQQLRVYVCGDTGPMHIASTFHVPSVILFGPTGMEHSGPYPTGEHQVILDESNISKISINQVLAAVIKLMS